MLSYLEKWFLPISVKQYGHCYLKLFRWSRNGGWGLKMFKCKSSNLNFKFVLIVFPKNPFLICLTILFIPYFSLTVYIALVLKCINANKYFDLLRYFLKNVFYILGTYLIRGFVTRPILKYISKRYNRINNYFIRKLVHLFCFAFSIHLSNIINMWIPKLYMCVLYKHIDN